MTSKRDPSKQLRTDHATALAQNTSAKTRRNLKAHVDMMEEIRELTEVMDEASPSRSK